MTATLYEYDLVNMVKKGRQHPCGNVLVHLRWLFLTGIMILLSIDHWSRFPGGVGVGELALVLGFYAVARPTMKYHYPI